MLSEQNKRTYLRVMGADSFRERGHPDEWANLDRLLDAARAEGAQGRGDDCAVSFAAANRSHEPSAEGAVSQEGR